MATSAAKKAPGKPAAKKAPAAPKPPKAERIVKNDVVLPREGSVTRSVWDIADAISKKKGEAATRSEVMEQAVAKGVNEATIATQFQRWRTFYGIERKVPAPKPPKAAKPAKAAKKTAPKSAAAGA